MHEIRKIGYSKSSKWEYRDNEFLNNNSFEPGWESFTEKTNEREKIDAKLGNLSALYGREP